MLRAQVFGSVAMFAPYLRKDALGFHLFFPVAQDVTSGVRHKNHAFLSFTYRIPNSALTTVT